MDVLVFDIEGRFGHFKKFYTTSSPLTFSVPPPTAIYGLVGAILGFEKEEYLDHINAKTTKIGIGIVKPVRKMRMSLNYIDTKNSGSFHLIKSRTQIRTEFLISPAYRIYIHINNIELFERLTEYIKHRKSHYTPSLGLANLLANLQYMGFHKADELSKAHRLSSIVPIERIVRIDPTQGNRYFKERLPVDMHPGRIVQNYVEFLMETEGKELRGEFEKCHRVGQEMVAMV